MSNLLVVFGATGQQGGSVANFVLNEPTLSKEYKIRGVTRDPSKDTASALQSKGVEIVKADLDDESSIKSALKDAHTVFAMTRTIYDEDAKSREVRQGKTIADAAVAVGAEYIIYSTEKHAGKISGGKYPVDSYDARAEVESYIRGLPIKSSYFAPATFFQNFAGMMGPKPAGDGTYAIANIHSPEAKFPWLDVATDTGKFVGTILAEPEKYEGQTLSAASSFHSLDEITKAMSEKTGKTIKYSQIPVEKYKSYLPPVAATTICNMFLYIQDFGYYGPKSEEEVEWSKEQLHGRWELVGLNEYLEKNPPKLA